MKVLKRNGRTEELDVSKIKKYTSEAVAGLANVSLSELEVDAKIQFRDMITTEEIQQTLIKTAVEKIDKSNIMFLISFPSPIFKNNSKAACF